MAGDRPRQPAYEIFSMKCRFWQSKSGPSESRRPARVDVREGYPCKKVYICSLLACLACKWLQIGTTMLLIITSTDDELLTNVNIDDLEWPWTIKLLILCYFLAIFGSKSVNCDEMNGDRLRLPANRNCYRLSRVSWALAQISCIICPVLCYSNRTDNKRRWKLNWCELCAGVVTALPFFPWFIRARVWDHSESLNELDRCCTAVNASADCHSRKSNKKSWWQ